MLIGSQESQSAAWWGTTTVVALFNHFVWLPNSRFRHDVRLTLMTSRCCPLLPASWRSKRRQTNYVLLWWGGQMASKRPLLPRNSVWHCSPLTPTSPDSTIRCESVTRWLFWTKPPKILGVTLDTHFTFVPHACDCVELLRGLITS